MTVPLRLRQDGVAWRRLEGEIVALDLDRSLYLSVNTTGAALWQSLAQGATTQRLEQILIDEYGADPQTAARDVAAFIAALQQQGLLVEAV